MSANRVDPYAPFEDRDFGTLQLDNNQWSIKRTLPGFKDEFEINLEAADGDIEPNDAQRRVFKTFLNTPQFRVALEAAYWEYYQDIVVGNYRPQMTIREAAELTPDLQTPSEVWPLITPYAIDVSPADPPVVHIWAGCKWDREYGADIDLVDGKRVVD